MKKYIIRMLLICIFSLVIYGCGNKNFEVQDTTSFTEGDESASSLMAVIDNGNNSAMNGVENIADDNCNESENDISDSFAPINIDEFSSGYITTEDTTIETRYLIIDIDKDIYVPDYFEEVIELACDEIELVSGLKFNEGPRATGKISVHVQKPSEETYRKDLINHSLVHNGGKPYTEKEIKNIINSIYSKNDDSGYVCYVISEKRVYLSASNLLAGDNGSALIHELSHALYFQYELPRWDFFSEGFAEETTVKVLRHLESKDFYTSSRLGLSYQHQLDLFLMFSDLLKEKPLDHWFVNTPPSMITPNDEHALGYNFMEYLDSLGGYTKWIKTYEDPDYNHEEILNFLNSVYNTDLEEGFYEWVDNLDSVQEKILRAGVTIPEKDKITFYPNSNWTGMTTSFPAYDHTMTCTDLTINLLEAKKYLIDIKNENVDDLYLAVPKLNDSAYIYLYDESGQYMSTVTSEGEVPLNDVGVVRIFNASSIKRISVKGYPENDDMSEEDETTSDTETVSQGKLMPLEGEGIEELQKMFKGSSAQNMALAKLGYYKAAEYVNDGVVGYAFLIPASHMKRISAGDEFPYNRYRDSFKRSGFDIDINPPTFLFNYNADVYIAFTPKKD